MIRFSPISFVLTELIAKNRGVPARQATTDALVGGFLPPVAGVVLVTALSQKQGSLSTGKHRGGGPPPLTIELHHRITKLGIDLEWNSIPGAAGYQLTRIDGAGAKETFPIFALTKPRYADNTAKGGNTYTYSVEAVGPDGKALAKSADVNVAKP